MTGLGLEEGGRGGSPGLPEDLGDLCQMIGHIHTKRSCLLGGSDTALAIKFQWGKLL